LGAASGMSNVSQQVGGAVGLALAATLVATRTRSLIASGNPAARAAVGGDQLAFTVAAVTLIAGFVISAVVLHKSAQHPSGA
jgi:hypothetical protein